MLANVYASERVRRVEALDLEVIEDIEICGGEPPLAIVEASIIVRHDGLCLLSGANSLEIEKKGGNTKGTSAIEKGMNSVKKVSVAI